ncbi:MAG: hypothetical protein MZV64_09800 [Ignavibacteriales bacterium]|nr:hypothetical protein [Ignavibacteriales bacterium]
MTRVPPRRDSRQRRPSVFADLISSIPTGYRPSPVHRPPFTVFSPSRPRSRTFPGLCVRLPRAPPGTAGPVPARRPGLSKTPRRRPRPPRKDPRFARACGAGW